jgi:hypothetical protein
MDMQEEEEEEQRRALPRLSTVVGILVPLHHLGATVATPRTGMEIDPLQLSTGHLVRRQQLQLHGIISEESSIPRSRWSYQ